jgi:hypothetical protein
MNRKSWLCVFLLLLTFAASAHAQTTWRYRCVNGVCYPEIVYPATSAPIATTTSYAFPSAHPVAQAAPQPQHLQVTDIVTIIEAVLQLRRDLQSGKPDTQTATIPPGPAPPPVTTIPPAPPTPPTPVVAPSTRDYTDDFRRVNDRLDRVTGDLANLTSALQGATQQVVVIRDRVGLLETRLQQVEANLKGLVH